MLIRISLIIAIIAGLAAGALNFIKVKEKIDTVVAERNDWHTKFDKTDAELTSTKSALAKTEKELNQTKETLVATQQERDKAVQEAEVQIKKATELADKLAKTTEERDTAQANLAAYVATGYKPEQIASLDKQIRKLQVTAEALQEEKKVLQIAYEKTRSELEYITGKKPYIELPASLKGKILVADPKWEFVVLDVGEEQGAKVHGELLVSRDGRLVGKVIISDVQKGRCIANVMPGWKLADVLEGDQVIPAHPES
jgi:hypothetical protein